MERLCEVIDVPRRVTRRVERFQVTAHAELRGALAKHHHAHICVTRSADRDAKSSDKLRLERIAGLWPVEGDPRNSLFKLQIDGSVHHKCVRSLSDQPRAPGGKPDHQGRALSSWLA